MAGECGDRRGRLAVQMDQHLAVASGHVLAGRPLSRVPGMTGKIDLRVGELDALNGLIESHAPNLAGER